MTPKHNITSDQIDCAKAVYDGLIEIYLKERGWTESEDSLWSKGDRTLLTNEEAYWAEEKEN
jgi:hypothetical protein